MPSAGEKLILIGDEFSWEAVIGLDGRRVARADAVRIFDEHGIDLPPEGPEEQRFIEVPVSPGKEWEREFEPNHNGPIHGWKVEQ